MKPWKIQIKNTSKCAEAGWRVGIHSFSTRRGAMHFWNVWLNVESNLGKNPIPHLDIIWMGRK